MLQRKKTEARLHGAPICGDRAASKEVQVPPMRDQAAFNPQEVRPRTRHGVDLHEQQAI